LSFLNALTNIEDCAPDVVIRAAGQPSLDVDGDAIKGRRINPD
jgi:hypothetical protein